MARPAERLATLDELGATISATFAIPLDRWLRASAVLHDARTQRRLDDWLTDGPPGGGSVAS